MANPTHVSLELLFHFCCGNCDGWWSLADFRWKDGKKICCPHCKHEVILPQQPTKISEMVEHPTPPMPPLEPAVMYQLVSGKGAKIDEP